MTTIAHGKEQVTLQGALPTGHHGIITGSWDGVNPIGTGRDRRINKLAIGFASVLLARKLYLRDGSSIQRGDGNRVFGIQPDVVVVVSRCVSPKAFGELTTHIVANSDWGCYCGAINIVKVCGYPSSGQVLALPHQLER